MEQPEEDQGAGVSPNPETLLQDGEEPFTSNSAVSSSSSSSADLPSATPAARCPHTSKTFTGLRMFCRRLEPEEILEALADGVTLDLELDARIM